MGRFRMGDNKSCGTVVWVLMKALRIWGQVKILVKKGYGSGPQR